MNAFELVLTAIDTIRASKLRAFLTTLGVIIGVLSIILLVALGEAARQYLQDTFASLGSNVIQVLPGRRETQGMPGGPVAGVAHKLTREDEQAIARRVYSLDGTSGIVQGGATVRNGNRRRDTYVFGVGSRFLDIRNLRVDTGRFFTDDDLEAHRRYVVLGRVIQDELFGSENPLGKSIKVADEMLSATNDLVR